MPRRCGTAALLIRIGQSLHACHPQPFIVDLSRTRELRFGRGARTEVRGESSGAACLTMDDPWTSEKHGRIVESITRGASTYGLEDSGSTNGCHVNGRRVASETLRHGDILEVGQTFWKFWHKAIDHLGDILALAYNGGAIAPAASFCPAFLHELWAAQRVARSDIPVIIQGESGSGKELMATELHRRSDRRGPMVALNCAAIPQTLIESELFGHRKGAFTGALSDRRGMIEEAQGGTLLLDEVGDMPLAAQAKLLRVLQEKTVVRVGDTSARPIDVRFLAATHRDLPQLVANDMFRGDLFARLNGFVLRLPPLRERKEDLGLLLAALLGRHASSRAADIRITHPVLRALALYDWPYNIRELDKVLASALALAGGQDLIQVAHLPPALRRYSDEASTGERLLSTAASDARTATPASWKQRGCKVNDEELRRRLTAAMRQHGGNIAAVARTLETTRMQVHRWLVRLGLDPRSFR